MGSLLKGYKSVNRHHMLAILQANGHGVCNQRPCLGPSIRHHYVCCYRGLFLLDVHLAVRLTSVCESLTLPRSAAWIGPQCVIVVFPYHIHFMETTA